MRQKPQHLLMLVILLYVNVPGIAQIDPLKTAKELGKSIPGKKDPTTSNPSSGRPASTESNTSNKPATTATNTSTGTNTATPLDAAAESSPAKSFIASFWKAIDKLKVASSAQQYHLYQSSITSAETNLRNIKMRDANYNTKPLETELEKYRAEQQAYNNQRLSNRNNATATDNFMSDLFDSNPTDYPAAGNMEVDIPKHKEKLQAFNDKVTQFLASNPDQTRIVEWEDDANQDASAVPSKVAELEKSINANTEKFGLITHRELIGMEAFWSVVCKIYPNLSAPATALQSVKSALGRLGTEEQLLAKFKQNLAEKMKNTKMPVAVAINPAVEAEFKKAFAETGWGETVVKISLLSRDWSTLYHNITGNIIGRTQDAAIAAKQKDGNCILYSFSIVQEYTGAGKYSSSRRYSNGVIADKFLCENAK